AAAIGSWTAGTSAAIVVGPPVGGFLVDMLSWRVIFALNVPIVLVCLALIARAVPDCPGDGDRRIDLPGALLCALGFGGPVYALIQQPLLGWSDPQTWVPLLGGIGALAAFVAYERRVPDPMLPLAVFRSRNFAVGNIVTLLVYAGLGAATFFVVIFLQQMAGYSALQAGLALTPVTLLMIALSRRFGALSAQIGPRLVMGAGPLVAGAGLLAFARLDERADYLSQVLPAVLLFGLGMAMTVAPLTATVLEAADRHHAGIASGVNNAVARVAGLLAIAALGAVVSAQFASRIDTRLPERALGPDARAYRQEALSRPLSVPRRAAPATVRAQVRAANVEAFGTGMLVAGGLMIAGGLIAFAGIENPRRRPAEHVEVRAASART
ncbi:MAG TPA: MFS transporter, partial [Solirubrobacteraceae bacterium]|nr:MFS transporter [Solirubrobacteraceae bacterium]